MYLPTLEIHRIIASMEHSLADFFRHIKQAGETRYFHPHPFDDENAKLIANYTGKDLYYAVLNGQKMLGYGILRGWDAGYEIPSLGIILLDEARRTGLSKMFMYFLHAAAKQRRTSQIRLKVYPENLVALNLYRRFGYVFQSEEFGQLVGKVTI